MIRLLQNKILQQTISILHDLKLVPIIVFINGYHENVLKDVNALTNLSPVSITYQLEILMICKMKLTS